MKRKFDAMEKVWIWLAYVMTLVTAWLAGIHNVYYGLLILQAIDIFTGVLVAMRRRTFRSSIGRVGIRRRMATWSLIVAIGVFQHHTGLLAPEDMPKGMGVAEWSAMGMAFMEFTSIVENCGKLGVSIPGWILNGLDKIKTVLGLTPRIDPADKGDNNDA